MARGDEHHALRDAILTAVSKKFDNVVLLPYQSGLARDKSGNTYSYGRAGVSDLIGMRSLHPKTTAEMIPKPKDILVLRPIAQFVALEVKTGKAKPSKKQQFFLDRVKELGGLAAVVHSVEEAIEVLKDGL